MLGQILISSTVAQSCLTLCNPMDCSTPGRAVCHHSQSLLKLMFIESVMPSNYLILCCPLLLLPSIFPSIRVFPMSQFFSTHPALWSNALIYTHSVQSLSHVRLFAIPWNAACQACLYITNSQSLLKLMFIESVMPSNHLILCHPLLLLPSIFPSIRVFSPESALHTR